MSSWSFDEDDNAVKQGTVEKKRRAREKGPSRRDDSDDDSVPSQILLTMDAFEKKRRAQEKRKQEKDSITKLYDNWVKFLEEHDYATPEQVHNFMGIRPRARRSINVDDDEELDLSKSCVTAPWACKSHHGMIREGLGDDGELDVSKSCISSPWARASRPQAITGTLNDGEEQALATRKGGLSKLSAQLASLKCIAGAPRGKTADSESRQDTDATEVDDGQEYETINRKLKGVTFLNDMVDDNNEIAPKVKKKRHTVDREKVKQALVELELFSCANDTDMWMELLRQADPYEIDEYSI